jgi:hypothetical protein
VRPKGGRHLLREWQGARAALNRPDLSPYRDTPEPEPQSPVPGDPYVDYPPLPGIAHPSWWHVYRLEQDGEVLIAECQTETAAMIVMTRERWQTRMRKWKCKSFDSFHPRKP